MWPQRNADFASAVQQPARPHHRLEAREEVRRQTVVFGEGRVIFGNQRVAHRCDEGTHQCHISLERPILRYLSWYLCWTGEYPSQLSLRQLWIGHLQWRSITEAKSRQ
jgi:hypothetical protein